MGNKVDVNLCREDGISFLCIVRYRGYDEIVKYLFSYGVDDKVIESFK